MTWWRAKKDRKKLETEIEQAQEMLMRVEEREPTVDKVHKLLTVEVAGNHMGDRLKEHFRQSRRRPGHGAL
jgi:hypothetical protein